MNGAMAQISVLSISDVRLYVLTNGSQRMNCPGALDPSCADAGKVDLSMIFIVESNTTGGASFVV